MEMFLLAMTLGLVDWSFLPEPVCAIEMLRIDVYLEWINGLLAEIR
jgi:hypothetical protein